MKLAPIKGISEIALIGANAVPLIGVLYWDWSVFDTMVLYWLENVVIGVLNILKLLTLPVLSGAARNVSSGKPPATIIQGLLLGRLFMIAFFTFHYGMFTMVHGLFVFALFGKMTVGSIMPHGMNPISTISALVQQAWSIETLMWPIIGLAISHVLSYIQHFWIEGERNQLTPQKLFGAPYSRVVVLHTVILLGGFLVLITKKPALALTLLVIIKTVVDLRAHRQSHNPNILPPTGSVDSAAL